MNISNMITKKKVTKKMFMLNLDFCKKHSQVSEKNNSCNTVLVRLIDTWLKDVDEGKLVYFKI